MVHPLFHFFYHGKDHWTIYADFNKMFGLRKKVKEKIRQ